MKIKDVYFMLNANDMDRAVRFWTDVFEAEVGFTSPFWTSMKVGGVSVPLHGQKPDTAVVDTGLGIDVDDVATALEAVVAAGGQALFGPDSKPEEGIILAGAADTEGNGFSISSDHPDRVR